MEKIGAFADADRVTAEGEWQPGNPATGQKATPMLSAWFNMLQRELLQVLSDAGVPPDVNNEAQLVAAIRGLVATTTQRGTVEKATTSEAKAGTADKFPDAAGVLAAFQQFGLGNSGAASIVTLNDAKTAGQYRFTSTDPDTPESGAAGPLLVLVNSSGAVTQIAIRNASGRMWVRDWDGSDWGSWSRFIHDDDMPAQLSVGGYQKLPSDLVIQWVVGPAISVDGSTTVTFPISFPNQCLGVWCIQSSGANDARFTPSNLSQSGVTINCFGASGTPRLLALGY